MDKPQVLPPDAPLLELAKAVNDQLPQETRVSFSRTVYPDQATETGIVFQYGPQRALVKTRSSLTVHDADALFAAVKRWVAGLRPDAWTTDPSEAA